VRGRPFFVLSANDKVVEEITLTNSAAHLLTLRASIPIANAIMLARSFRLPTQLGQYAGSSSRQQISMCDSATEPVNPTARELFMLTVNDRWAALFFRCVDVCNLLLLKCFNLSDAQFVLTVIKVAAVKSAVQEFSDANSSSH
jgi:hypothetical protein